MVGKDPCPSSRGNNWEKEREKSTQKLNAKKNDKSQTKPRVQRVHMGDRLEIVKMENEVKRHRRDSECKRQTYCVDQLSTT